MDSSPRLTPSDVWSLGGCRRAQGRAGRWIKSNRSNSPPVRFGEMRARTGASSWPAEPSPIEPTPCEDRRIPPHVGAIYTITRAFSMLRSQAHRPLANSPVNSAAGAVLAPKFRCRVFGQIACKALISRGFFPPTERFPAARTHFSLPSGRSIQVRHEIVGDAGSTPSSSMSSEARDEQQG